MVQKKALQVLDLAKEKTQCSKSSFCTIAIEAQALRGY